MFWNSSGTRSERSASFCPATSDQSSTASANDSSFSPKCRNSLHGHQPNENQRCARVPFAPYEDEPAQPAAQLVLA